MCIRDRLIPLQDKIEKFLLSKGIVKQRADNGKLEPTSRDVYKRQEVWSD